MMVNTNFFSDSCGRKHLTNSSDRYQSGLTLIELLVSLVLLGFVITIMSGAFFQVAKVVNIAENVNGAFQMQWVRINSLKNLVGNLVLPEEVQQPFSGNSEGFQAYSLSLPQTEWGSIQKFNAKLQISKDGHTDLLISLDDATTGIVVASWGVPVKLEYLTVDGTFESMWPPMGRKADALPRGVAIRANSGEQAIQMVALYEGARVVEPNAKNEMNKLFGITSK